MSRTDLYRFYDANDQLLYVGISLHAAKRASEHRKDKPWWPDVARMEVEHLPTREAAEEAERLAIQYEQPFHNVTHNRQVGTTEQTIIWRCQQCGEPIGKRSGIIEVDVAAAMARFKKFRDEERNRGDWQPVDLKALFAAGEREPWLAYHFDCDPRPLLNGYSIRTDDIQTAWDLLDWSAHLSGKAWFPHTDWWGLMRLARITISPARAA